MKTTPVPPHEENLSEAVQPNASRTLLQIVIKATALALGIALILLIVTGLVFGAYLYRKATLFSQYAGTPLSELKQLAQTALTNKPTTIAGKKTLLLLGTDAVTNRGDAPVLTDAIVLITIDTTTGKISLLSLPRDIWSDAYQTKINALLHYGFERYPENPAQFPTEVLSEMTGIPIQHTLVIHLHNVADIIGILGGVQLDVTRPFTDTQYPRDDVDITTEKNPELLYKTVQFETGVQVLDGERALEYMRSRHSAGEEGTDTARAKRQQEVFGAMVAQLTSAETLLDTKKMAELFSYYKNNFSQYLSLEELGATAVAIAPHRDTISLFQTTPPITTTGETGVIYHPQPTRTQPQWIYAITDPVTFKQFAQDSLDMPVTER